MSMLTPREQEVAVLVAEELTNRQIASDLMLSEHTVATHVRNMLKKLGLQFQNPDHCLLYRAALTTSLS